MVLKFESLDGKLSEKSVGRWTLNGIPLPLRNFKRVTCFRKYEVSLFHVFFVILSSFLIFPIHWRQSISDALGVVCAVFGAQLGHSEPASTLVPSPFFLVRPCSGHIKLKKC